ncbi:MAG: molybdenum cofactor biosynthesis protein MoaE [Hyphomicrobiales bacterium]|nr:molybdenum cofactor biosynthesis protein MoaE [Hyphomicrobiales bacterium]
MVVRVQSQVFDVGAEIAALTRGRSDVGAVVTFTGLCRDEGGRLAALQIEHYPGMAEEEIARVVGEAQNRWPLQGVSVVHRHGRIAAGEEIVLVVTLSVHRRAAFEAAEFLMDYLKTNAPFWKKELRLSEGAGEWVEAKTSDAVDAERWRRQG